MGFVITTQYCCVLYGLFFVLGLACGFAAAFSTFLIEKDEQTALALGIPCLVLCVIFTAATFFTANWCRDKERTPEEIAAAQERVAYSMRHRNDNWLKIPVPERNLIVDFTPSSPKDADSGPNVATEPVGHVERPAVDNWSIDADSDLGARSTA